MVFLSKTESEGCGIAKGASVHRALTLMVCLDVNAAHIKTHRESGGVVAAPQLVAKEGSGCWGVGACDETRRLESSVEAPNVPEDTPCWR